MFVSKVKETEAELKEERELHERFEMLKRAHLEEKMNLEEKRRDLEEEKNSFTVKRVAAETLQTLQGSSSFKKDKEKKTYLLLLLPFFPISVPISGSPHL
ncbi:septin-8-B-like [Carassius gibelio]|uniref:septin-8-B-like n=1 Tax=Carassius gibelio TaxID=101364 RepID=UPI002277520E|nr:septin-8-B-like [Carassius gibelio]